MPSIPLPKDLRINAARFLADFEALAAIGSTQDGGVNRPALSEAHLQSRVWFRERAERAGLVVSVDGAGSHFARLACGQNPERSLLLGSHLDSVPMGGRFDGALGVAAALEVLETVREAGLHLPVDLEAVDFTDEEGTLVGLLGSAALANHLQPAEIQNPRGGRQRLLDGLQRAGLSEAGLFQAGRDPASLAGYLELHIEQGPRLERKGIPVGVVTAIVGIVSYRLVFEGRANHAGTTPMDERCDAGLGAAGFMLAARRLVLQSFPECVVNVGALKLEPGAFNIVPGRAELALEFRSADQQTLDQLQQALLALAEQEARAAGLSVTAVFLGRHEPAPMHPAMRQAIGRAAADLGLVTLDLPSGAGHDGQSLANLCPTGMIFIPSQAGISHSPHEFSAWHDCVNGANLLLQAALNFNP